MNSPPPQTGTPEHPASHAERMARTKKDLEDCSPHKETLSASERRLIGICQWALTANTPISDEQAVWLSEIAQRVSSR